MAKLTKAQARKRLNEARGKAIAVLAWSHHLGLTKGQIAKLMKIQDGLDDIVRVLK